MDTTPVLELPRLSATPTTPPLTDDQLVARIRAGDVEECMATLMTRYGESLYDFVRKIIGDAHVAQDIVQEVFVKVLLKSQHFQLGTEFRAWLFTVARNQAISARRSRERWPRQITGLADAWSRPARSPGSSGQGDEAAFRFEEGEIMDAFRDAVEALPDNNRVVFRECVMAGRKYRDVAGELGVPVGTVAIRIMRARKRLYLALERYLRGIRRRPACFE